MSTKPISLILMGTATVSFICSYFLGLAIDNAYQFIAVAIVILVDGLFGILAGIKREGFKTFKAISILRTLAIWWVILGAILAIEKGFTGTGWLSETIIGTFMVFQIISALKNASMAGYIKAELMNIILDKIDSHKGFRK
jgi:hypothetical protein